MLRFEECVHDCDELSSDCCDDDLVWLSCVPQTICEDLEYRILVACDESGLEHDVSNLSPSATNGSLATHRTAGQVSD